MAISQIDVNNPGDTDKIYLGPQVIRKLALDIKSQFPGVTDDFSTAFTTDWVNTLVTHLRVEGADLRVGSADGHTRCKLTNVEDGTDPQDVATKAQLDTLQAQLDILQNSLNDSSYPIGSIFQTIKAGNPQQLLGFGTWDLIKEGVYLEAAAGGSSDLDHTISEGDNVKQVPLKQHDHSATFHGHAMAHHAHAARTTAVATTDAIGYVGHGTDPYPNLAASVTVEGASAGTPSGTITVDQAGDADSTLDVRGARVKVYIWVRTGNAANPDVSDDYSTSFQLSSEEFSTDNDTLWYLGYSSDKGSDGESAGSTSPAPVPVGDKGVIMNEISMFFDKTGDLKGEDNLRFKIDTVDGLIEATLVSNYELLVGGASYPITFNRNGEGYFYAGEPTEAQIAAQKAVLDASVTVGQSIALVKKTA